MFLDDCSPKNQSHQLPDHISTAKSSVFQLMLDFQLGSLAKLVYITRRSDTIPTNFRFWLKSFSIDVT